MRGKVLNVLDNEWIFNSISRGSGEFVENKREIPLINPDGNSWRLPPLKKSTPLKVGFFYLIVVKFEFSTLPHEAERICRRIKNCADQTLLNSYGAPRQGYFLVIMAMVIFWRGKPSSSSYIPFLSFHLRKWS